MQCTSKHIDKTVTTRITHIFTTIIQVNTKVITLTIQPRYLMPAVKQLFK
jgi:hypothetical protein